MNERSARRRRVLLIRLAAVPLLLIASYFAAFHFGGSIQNDFAVHVPETDGTLRTLRNVRAHFYREPFWYRYFTLAAWVEAKLIQRPVLVGERTPRRPRNTDIEFDWYEP